MTTLLLLCTLVTGLADGDTFFLENDQTVRLYNVDTPEAWESDKLYEDARNSPYTVEEIQAWGRAVSDSVRSIVVGECVEVYEVERGYYGRSIVKVWLDGVYLNEYIRRRWNFPKY